MNYVICVPDGAADEPVPALGDRTPLAAAAMPNLARLAATGEVGRAATIPAGFPPGSDVGNLSILGYDPARYHTGRAPIEAAAMGLRLAPDQVAYRCNLATVSDDGIMVDFAGGHPTSETAAPIIAALEAELGGRDGISFHPGVQYRHILVAPAALSDAECTPPHDLIGQPAAYPTGPAAARLNELMEASRAIVGRFDTEATQIWLWGQGAQPELPPFRATWGLDAALVSAVDLVRGLGALARILVVAVEGATGWYDTNYEGKRDACLQTLADGADLFLIHVEASDEAGHAGNLEAKVEALENWDRRIIGPLVEGLDSLGEWRLLLLPDHPTFLRTRTHTADPVPYLLASSARNGPGGTYSEAGTDRYSPVAGHSRMGRLVAVASS